MKFLLNINHNLCTRCGKCIENCPKHIITLDTKNIKNIDETKCDGCSNCIVYCKEKAITISYE